MALLLTNKAQAVFEKNQPATSAKVEDVPNKHPTTKASQQQRKKDLVVDSGLENMSESWSSLITGQQRKAATQTA